MVKSVLDFFEKGTTPNGAKYYSLGIFDEKEIEIIHVTPRTPIRTHYHRRTSSIFYMVKGTGTLVRGKKKIAYKKGDVFRIPRKIMHGVFPKSETIFLAIESPAIENPRTGKVDMAYS